MMGGRVDMALGCESCWIPREKMNPGECEQQGQASRKQQNYRWQWEADKTDHGLWRVSVDGNPTSWQMRKWVQRCEREKAPA